MNVKKKKNRLKSVHPSLKKGRKSVFMVSLAQSKKTSNYHSALRSMPRPPVGLPSPSFRPQYASSRPLSFLIGGKICHQKCVVVLCPSSGTRGFSRNDVKRVI